MLNKICPLCVFLFVLVTGVTVIVGAKESLDVLMSPTDDNLASGLLFSALQFSPLLNISPGNQYYRVIPKAQDFDN
jgi:hypothetical protein